MFKKCTASAVLFLPLTKGKLPIKQIYNIFIFWNDIIKPHKEVQEEIQIDNWQKQWRADCGYG